MKTVIVKVHSANRTTQEIAIATKDGQPNTIKAGKYVNYEFFDTSIDRAPNHIITKRVDNHLHVSFEREGQEVDLIIEDFYDNDDQALIGIAEDGTYYHYIPDTGQVSDYVTQLEAGNIEGQALGGEEMVAPWWVTAPAGFPWWLGLGLIPLPFIKDNKDSDLIDPVNDVEANPEVESIAEDTVLTGNVITNDSDENGATLTVQSATVDVDGTGTPVALVLGTATTLTATDGSAIGELTLNADGSYRFDPAPNFHGTVPTVNYTVTDPDGNTDETTLDITVDPVNDAPVAENDSGTGTSGSPVVVAVVGNDSDVEGDLDPTTVVISQSPAGSTIADDGKSVTVAGEGSWVVDATTGDITFTPEADFTGDPTPISYTVDDRTGETSNEATVTIDYPQTAPVAVDDSSTGTSGSPVVVAVVGNDSDVEGDLDPTTVVISQSPAGSTIADDGKSVTVAGEGSWVVDATTGDITFTPEADFTGDPTPISYTVDDRTGETSNEATVTIDYDQPTNISVSSPARVSEEGLAGGNPDTNPDSTLDTTDSATDTDNNWIRVTDTDTDLSNSVVNFVLPTAVQNITSQGNPVDFRIDSATGNIVGEYTYTDSAGAPQVQNVLTISLNGNKEAITDGYQFGYDVVLGAPVDHILGDNTEGVLPVSFGIEVFENATATESLAKSDELLVIVEDDSPLPQPVVWNIDVQQETITINGLQTGFDETLFTRPTRAGYLIADADNVAAGSTGTTVESRNYWYGGTIGRLSAEQDATYQAGDGNTYVDSLDEGIYWGRPGGRTPPAGYTTYENTNYQGAGQGVKFETDIDLGNFSHINSGILGDGGTLIETNLNVDFTIDVNGNSEPISVDYLLKHNETPNGNTAEFYGLTSAEYDATFVASDFIIIPNASRVITIAGQQYKLDLELVNKDPNAAVDSDRNKTFLKAYQTKINGFYDPALDDEGTFVVNSEEGKENTYDIIGKLTPLNPLPELADNVVIAGQVAVGADAVDYTNPTGTGIVWSGTSTTGANGIAIIDTDSDMTNYEFKTDYGVFVGYANGSYKFSAAKNISEIVSPGQDDIDVFSFTYKDADGDGDGDTATSTVTLNYNEYATPQNPNSIDNLAPRGTDNNDYLLGTNQAETLNGGAGNDNLVGLSGADTLLGGEGSDTIVFDKNDVSIDGGTNLDGSQENDTLVITDTSIIASNDMNNVTNFETLDLTNNTAQTLNLNLSDVISMTDGNNQLFIKGDSVDTVNVSGMTKSGTSDQAGYDLYQDAGSIAQLYIQTDIIDNVI
ncbi:Ig-like domain-containing protein [Psychrobacter immobilis]|uniref:Ig-like domain-containing protein n=1 Tax=Psychrobacter immobilis TaxID=498 RepID=UPI001919774D|nr:Ig-like domain-containing protein [Psychrobacter immobilis]